ncbi:hypothetical protein CAPTEDRAFT_31404, partial [Capitella teleta]
LNEDAQPVIAPSRKYPIQLREEISKKLEEMEKNEVIKKCDDTEASEWIDSLAFTLKANDELRMCLDPKHLNMAIKR